MKKYQVIKKTYIMNYKKYQEIFQIIKKMYILMKKKEMK